MPLPDHYDTLRLSIPEPGLLLVELDRPDAMNALNTRTGRDLLDPWTRLTEDPEALRRVVLTGTGDRAFCACGDLEERDATGGCGTQNLPRVVGERRANEIVLTGRPLSVRQAEKSIRHGMWMALRAAFRVEVEACDALVATDDRHEGVRAFNGMRQPRFEGCRAGLGRSGP